MKKFVFCLIVFAVFLTLALGGCGGWDVNVSQRNSTQISGESSEYGATSSEMSGIDSKDSTGEEQSDAFATTPPKTYFECRLEYFVNPIPENEELLPGTQFGVYGAYGSHAMDNIVKLLSLDAFWELLIDDMEGVPSSVFENKATTEYEAFRQTERYAVLLNKVQSSLVFSYELGNESLMPLIYVDLSVKEDENFAEKLLENLIKNVTSYVEEYMVIPSGYIGTRCVLIKQDVTLKKVCRAGN